MYSGLRGSGIGSKAFSRELNDSIVTNYERIAGLETFDDTLFSSRVVGANISYNVGRTTILEDANVTSAYNHCVGWINAGKPTDFDWQWPDLAAAMASANQAAEAAEAGLNN